MSVGLGRITALGPGANQYASVGFTTFQTPNGTSPVADGPSDTLTLTSSDSTVTITGNAATDTIDFTARVATATESGIVSISTQTFQGSKTFSAITNFNTTSSSVSPVQIKGAASQSENLTRWLDSSNNLKAYVDPNGNLGFGTLIGTTATVSANATLNANTYIHKVNGSISSFTATLPGHVAGKSIIVYNPSQDYDVTVAAGTGTLYGPTDLSFSATTEKEAALYTSDGTDWYGFRIGKPAEAVGTVPVGGIVAWHASITGVPSLPSEYVQCNGGTIANALSPMNGQTIPDINNGNQFLRGNSTSGGTGGTTCHQHTLGALCVDGSSFTFNAGSVDLSGGSVSGSDSGTVTIGDSPSTAQFDQNGGTQAAAITSISYSPSFASSWSGSISGTVNVNGGSLTGCGSISGGSTTDFADNLPPYFNIVWVMRIY